MSDPSITDLCLPAQNEVVAGWELPGEGIEYRPGKQLLVQPYYQFIHLVFRVRNTHRRIYQSSTLDPLAGKVSDRSRRDRDIRVLSP